MERSDELKNLLKQFELLAESQEKNRLELQRLKTEIERLSAAITKQEVPELDIVTDFVPLVIVTEEKQNNEKEKDKDKDKEKTPSTTSQNQLEEYIGGNLISKLGIVILVLGISLGAKYAIDHNLIGPFMRIALGYFASVILFVLSFRFKLKYAAFSAVLVSGALASAFYLTFVSSIYYDFFPREVAFALMVGITVFSVVTAIKRDVVFIAHFGLIGAYSIPILLSDGSGNIAFLFSYITLINSAILVLSYIRSWNSVYVNAFIITTIYFSAWTLFSFEFSKMYLGLIFGMVFYVQFYLMALWFSRAKKEEPGYGDGAIILINNLVYFGLGIFMLSMSDNYENYRGLYTFSHAALNFLCAYFVFRYYNNKIITSFALGIGLVFFTIAIPIQSDGNYLLFLWSSEALLLTWIGRKYAVIVFEGLSYLLWLLSAVLVSSYWINGSLLTTSFTKAQYNRPILNTEFGESVYFLAALLLAFMVLIRMKTGTERKGDFIHFMKIYVLPVLVLVSVYFIFRVEIVNLLEGMVFQSVPDSGSVWVNFNELTYNRSYFHAGQVILIGYSILFALSALKLNQRFIRSEELKIVLPLILGMFLIQYLVLGNYHLKLLNFYSSSDQTSNYFVVFIRYLNIPFVVYSILMLRNYLRSEGKNDFKLILTVSMHLYVLAVLSLEFLYWMNYIDATHSTKLGLSIIWVFYCLYLFIHGIRKRAAVLRFLAMAILLFTLVKLFFYDIAHLTTLAKTIIFIAIGAIMLLVSYLYNKFKDSISE